MLTKRIFYKNILNNNILNNNIILKRTFFKTIENTKVTKEDILHFQNSINLLFIFCSTIWAIETQQKLNELNKLYNQLFYSSFIRCKTKTKNRSLCQEIYEYNINL